jgi:hypothetical protein
VYPDPLAVYPYPFAVYPDPLAVYPDPLHWICIWIRGREKVTSTMKLHRNIPVWIKSDGEGGGVSFQLLYRIDMFFKKMISILNFQFYYSQ